MPSKFYFLESKYSKLYLISQSAEILSVIDTGACMAKCRLFAEEMVCLVRKMEKLENPFNMPLRDKISDLKNRNIIPKGVNKLFHSLRHLGNKGAHTHIDKIDDKLLNKILSECYYLSLWFIFTYENKYVEDKRYKNLRNVSVTVAGASATKAKESSQSDTVYINTEAGNEVKDINEIEKAINDAPSYSGNMALKVIELNDDKENIHNRRKRSKKFDQMFPWSGLAGLGLGTAGAIAIGVSPVGLATGIVSGLGFLAHKYIKGKKDKD